MKSIADLNNSQKSAEGYEFEYIDEHGNDTGIFFTVIGDKAPSVKAWTAKKFDKRNAYEESMKRRGKQAEPLSAEENLAFGIEFVAIRIVAWRGIEEPCTLENAITLLKNNDFILEQIKRESENITNFTKSKSPN